MTRLVVERLDVDASSRRRDRDVTTPDRPMERPADEPVRAVLAEGVEAPGREREGVRLRELEEGYTCEVTPAWSSAEASSAHEYM